MFSLGGEHIGWFGELLLNNAKYISEVYYENLNIGKIFKNDVLLVKDGATIGKVAIADNIPFEKCAVNEHVFILRSNSNFSYKYLFFFIWCYIGQEQIQQNIKGSAQPGLNSNFINEVFIPLPPLPEQTAIANYLDKKTTQIDELIVKKERLIELLEEEKNAVINEAVTGKAPITKNQTTKYKDSGIEWLGEIPEHWEVKKLRYLAKITTGDKDTENREDNAEYPFFVRSQNIERISTYSFNGEAILTAGDGVGVCKVWHYIVGKFDFHQRVYMMYNFSNISGKYLYYFMKENFIHDVLKKSAKSTVDSLRRTMFLNFLVAYPKSEKEQIAIIQYIEKETTRIDRTIEKTKKLIELLKEYRTALISEVVTGKVKVN